MLCVNACSPICCQGNIWSTCCAAVMIPSALHPAHIGYWLNCICLSVRHCAVLYRSDASLRLSVLLYLLWLNVSRPPCSVHRLLNFALVFLHPNVLHLVLLGTVGITLRTSAYKWCGLVVRLSRPVCCITHCLSVAMGVTAWHRWIG